MTSTMSCLLVSDTEWVQQSTHLLCWETRLALTLLQLLAEQLHAVPTLSSLLSGAGLPASLWLHQCCRRMFEGCQTRPAMHANQCQEASLYQ